MKSIREWYANSDNAIWGSLITLFFCSCFIALMVFGHLLAVKEQACELACWDNGWPNATYNDRLKSCYCHNDSKKVKAYTLGK